MRLLRTLALVSVAVLGGVALLVFGSLPSRVPAPEAPLAEDPTHAVGVLHVHSDYSDGAGTVPQILDAASQAGLDFVVLTDHGDPLALGAEGEGYAEGVLLLVGSEISTEGGHVLALDILDPVFRFGTDTAEALRDVDEMGGFSLAAHPTALRENFAWDGWELPGLTGIELFNFFTGFRRQSASSLVTALLVIPFSARRGLMMGLEWEPGLVETWDRLLAERDLTAWVGLDAHGRWSISEETELSWPGYRDVFSMARNHLVLDAPLVGDAAVDRERVYRALERGQGYMSFDGIADGSRFRFFAQADGREWPMGAHLPASLVGEIRLIGSVEAPPGTRLRILRNGTLVRETTESILSIDVDEPGVYRAEARLDPAFVPGERDQPWIVGNPIFVLPREEIDRRALQEKEFPSRPTAEGMTCQPVGEGSWPVAFHAEHDPASRMDEAAAESSRGAFRMDFQLSEPAADRPYVWCAVADRTPRDLTGLEAVRFEARGDRVFRVDFQIRDANPDSPDEQTEWWKSTFKATEEWQEFVLRFDGLRSITQGSDGRLDLDRVEGMFFVLDAGNTRPGTAGIVAVRELQFCTSTPASR